MFIDRDGTLIIDLGYPRDPARVELLPGAIDALRALGPGFALVIVSNQSGIGRGLITPAEARAVHERTIELFAAAGVRFAGSYYCPHAPDARCACRKPAPGLLLEAARELGLDLARSCLVGDKPSDVEAGRAAGCCQVIRIGPPAGEMAGEIAGEIAGKAASDAPGHAPDERCCADWACVAAALGAAV